MNSAVKSDKQLSSMELQRPSHEDAAPLRKVITVAAIGAGTQFGWALQLSLLTPYIQLLGTPHQYASFIWLCGPISGIIVQPLVGYFSDRCNSRFGRRRPFIAAGTALIAVAALLIAFAADIGHIAGDLLIVNALKPRAIAVFIVGMLLFDVANNMVASPCRALLADLSAGDPKRTRAANALFTLFMAIGNIVGDAAGAYSHLYKLFPFSATRACNVYCANLKSCFFLSIALLVTLTTLAVATVREKPLSEIEPGETVEPAESKRVPFFGELFSALKGLPRSMWILLLVTCLNWFAWYSFLLFDTDWMGREVYGGKPGDKVYDHGVRAGALALMLNSVVVGITSLGMEYMAHGLGGVTRLWGGVNILLAAGLAMTVVITKKAESARHLAAVHNISAADAKLPGTGVKIGAFALFAVLGIPLAIMYSVPFALASIFSSNSGAGQGLSQGVLNLANCIPSMIVSLTAGPWDALFGGGNLPTFVVGAVAAVASGLLAMIMLPSPPPDNAFNQAAVGAHQDEDLDF